MDTVTFKTLEAERKRIENTLPENLGLRMRRATSWIGRAEKASDADARFIFYWIAFNAIYGSDTSDQPDTEEAKFREYFGRVLNLDPDRRIYYGFMQKFSGSIDGFIGNRYVFKPFWSHYNGRPGYGNWRARFDSSYRDFGEAMKGGGDAKVILSTLFDRLYVLRNQLVHGGATWDGSKNRCQVEDGAHIMAFLVPLFVSLMMTNPQVEWGPSHYPVV